jgi:hypothetical protein
MPRTRLFVGLSLCALSFLALADVAFSSDAGLALFYLGLGVALSCAPSPGARHRLLALATVASAGGALLCYGAGLGRPGDVGRVLAGLFSLALFCSSLLLYSRADGVGSAKLEPRNRQ